MPDRQILDRQTLPLVKLVCYVGSFLYSKAFLLINGGVSSSLAHSIDPNS